MYEIRPAEGCRWIRPLGQSIPDIVTMLLDERVDHLLVERSFESYDPSPDRTFKEVQTPWLVDGLLACRAKALEALLPAIAADVEILPISVNGIEHGALLNVVKIRDVLDHESSELLYFASSGRLMGAKRYAFRDTTSGDNMIKVSDLPNGPIFVSELVMRSYKAASLQGWTFKRVGVSA